MVLAPIAEREQYRRLSDGKDTKFLRGMQISWAFICKKVRF
jgi:hypothetical protein